MPQSSIFGGNSLTSFNPIQTKKRTSMKQQNTHKILIRRMIRPNLM